MLTDKCPHADCSCMCVCAWGSSLAVPQIDKGHAFITSLSLSRGLSWVSIDSNEHSSREAIQNTSMLCAYVKMKSHLRDGGQNISAFIVKCTCRRVCQSIWLFDSVCVVAGLGYGSSSSRAGKGPELNTPGEGWSWSWLQCCQSGAQYGPCMVALVWRFLSWAYHPWTSRRRMLRAVPWETHT